MHHERVELLEAALVGEHVDTLACGEFAAVVLSLNPPQAAALRGLFLAAIQVLKPLLDAQ